MSRYYKSKWILDAVSTEKKRRFYVELLEDKVYTYGLQNNVQYRKRVVVWYIVYTDKHSI